MKLKIQERTNQQFMLQYISENGKNCGVSLENVNYVKITNQNRLVYVNGEFIGIAHKKFPVNIFIDFMCLGRLYDIDIQIENGDTNISIDWR